MNIFRQFLFPDIPVNFDNTGRFDRLSVRGKNDFFSKVILENGILPTLKSSRSKIPDNYNPNTYWLTQKAATDPNWNKLWKTYIAPALPEGVEKDPKVIKREFLDNFKQYKKLPSNQFPDRFALKKDNNQNQILSFKNHPNIKSLVKKTSYNDKDLGELKIKGFNDLNKSYRNIEDNLAPWLKNEFKDSDYSELKNNFNISSKSTKSYNKDPELVRITTKGKDNIPSLQLYTLLDNLPKETTKTDIDSIIKDKKQIKQHTEYASGFGGVNAQLTRLTNIFSDLINDKGLEIIDIKSDYENDPSSANAYKLNLDPKNPISIMTRSDEYSDSGMSPINYISFLLQGKEFPKKDNKVKRIPYNINSSIFTDSKAISPKEMDFNANEDLSEFVGGIDNYIKKNNARTSTERKKYAISNSEFRDLIDKFTFNKLPNELQKDRIFISDKVYKAITEDNPSLLKNYFKIDKNNKLAVRGANPGGNAVDDRLNVGLRYEHALPMVVLGRIIGKVLDNYRKIYGDNFNEPKNQKIFIDSVKELISHLYTVAYIPANDDDNLRAIGLNSKLSSDKLNIESTIDKLMKDGKLSPADIDQIQDFIYDRWNQLGLKVLPVSQTPNTQINYPVIQQSESLKSELKSLLENFSYL